MPVQGWEVSAGMRMKALALVTAVAAVLPGLPSRSENRIATRSFAASIAQLNDQLPDGADLIDLYKAAHTVADIEAANASVREQVGKAQTAASEFARLHAAKMTFCEKSETPQLDATAAKAKMFASVVARIDGELARSLAAMRQRLASERSTSTRAKDDVSRLLVAVHEVGRLNLQSREIANAIEGVARATYTVPASCDPTPIPPLFAVANPPPRIASITRPRPAPRRPPAAAAPRPVRFLPRF